ncbi:unnamed protein product [Amoebophrya sp. A25]|nr:unnamed protein product [Amoebophrya sp. A25]|eukprot:GSA25T00024251001.1
MMSGESSKDESSSFNILRHRRRRRRSSFRASTKLILCGSFATGSNLGALGLSIASSKEKDGVSLRRLDGLHSGVVDSSQDDTNSRRRKSILEEEDEVIINDHDRSIISSDQESSRSPQHSGVSEASNSLKDEEVEHLDVVQQAEGVKNENSRHNDDYSKMRKNYYSGANSNSVGDELVRLVDHFKEKFTGAAEHTTKRSADDEEEETTRMSRTTSTSRLEAIKTEQEERDDEGRGTTAIVNQDHESGGSRAAVKEEIQLQGGDVKELQSPPHDHDAQLQQSEIMGRGQAADASRLSSSTGNSRTTPTRRAGGMNIKQEVVNAEGGQKSSEKEGVLLSASLLEARAVELALEQMGRDSHFRTINEACCFCRTAFTSVEDHFPSLRSKFNVKSSSCAFGFCMNQYPLGGYRNETPHADTPLDDTVITMAPGFGGGGRDLGAGDAYYTFGPPPVEINVTTDEGGAPGPAGNVAPTSSDASTSAVPWSAAPASVRYGHGIFNTTWDNDYYYTQLYPKSAIAQSVSVAAVGGTGSQSNDTSAVIFTGPHRLTRRDPNNFFYRNHLQAGLGEPNRGEEALDIMRKGQVEVCFNPAKHKTLGALFFPCESACTNDWCSLSSLRNRTGQEVKKQIQDPSDKTCYSGDGRLRTN